MALPQRTSGGPRASTRRSRIANRNRSGWAAGSRFRRHAPMFVATVRLNPSRIGDLRSNPMRGAGTGRPGYAMGTARFGSRGTGNGFRLKGNTGLSRYQGSTWQRMR
jgi:hypothetical protein